MDEIMELKNNIDTKDTGINIHVEEKMNFSDNFLQTFSQRDEVQTDLLEKIDIQIEVRDMFKTQKKINIKKSTDSTKFIIEK